MQGKLLRVHEVASQLGLQPSTVRSWILRRRMAFVRVGSRSIRVPSTEVDRIIDAGTVPMKEKGNVR